ncbi:MAG: hypothetical protein AB1782_10825 [Cyanobacteriota bacterium]
MSYMFIIPLVIIILIFIVSLCTKLTLGYIFFGPLALWGVRTLFRKPEIMTAFSLGIKAAFWPYLIYLLLGILVFRSLCVCPFLHIFGLIVIPLLSGGITLLFNFIPESEKDKNKPDLEKYGYKI